MDKINERLQELYQRRATINYIMERASKRLASTYLEYQKEPSPYWAFQLSLVTSSLSDYNRELSAIEAQISEFEI